MQEHERIINIRRQLRDFYSKEQMSRTKKTESFIIPTPDKGEEKDAYVSRCIAAIIDEYGQEQSAGICYGQWENK